MTIVLPLPHKRLSPNTSSHWRKKAAQVKVHRRRAKILTLSALGGNPPPTFTGYRLAFFFPTVRTRDDDNAIASCKAYRDGIADGLKVDDSTLVLAARPSMQIDRANPRVEITLVP
jgi:crossover junction endodeoxyribonuclease RusA